jgi:hypothetical protein
MISLETFSALRNYVKGKISGEDLLDADKLFHTMRENYNSRGDSRIRINFKNRMEFLEKMGFNDDDAWFATVITNPYSDYEFMDSYSAIEDFMEGYSLYYYLNEENKEILSEISKAILPMKVDFENETFRKALSGKLMTNFGEEIKDLIYNYTYERNLQMRNSAEKTVEEDLKDYFDKLGLDAYDDGFTISVGDLIGLYLTEGDIHLDASNLFEKHFNRVDKPGGWQENYYDYVDDNEFDSESFSREAYRIFNKILDKIEDFGVEEGATIEDFTNMTDRITKKFKQNEYYYLPKDSTRQTRFKINGFEFPAMKVVVTLQKGLKQKTVSLSEQNFYNLLYQPSLFSLDEI